jgi:hypothetical protein
MPDSVQIAEPGPTPQTQGAVATDWRPHLTAELQADPIVKTWADKASEKDITSLIKTVAHGQHRMGSAINLPAKDAKPEEVAALRTKLIESGVIPAAPKDRAEYGLTKMDKLPENLRWSDELAGKFGDTLLKHGIPKAALDDLMPLYMEALTGSVKALAVDREKAMAKLQQDHGEQYGPRKEAVGRMAHAIFQTPEELQLFEELGLADHPGFLSVMLRLAPLAMQDSSFMNNIPSKGGEISGEDARSELAKIISDKEHPHHAGFKKIPIDPKTDAYVQDLYRKAYGNQKAPSAFV